jgi:hypothetical protein
MEQKKNNEQKADAKSVSQPIAKPHVIGSQSQLFDFRLLDKKKLLEIIFDLKYSTLKNSFILNESEYNKHKDWSVNSGFLEFQIYCQLNESHIKS